MFELFKKIWHPQPEIKSSPLYLRQNNQSFYDFLISGGYEDLSLATAIIMYRRVMPLFSAIDIRAQAYSQIPIKLRNRKTKELIDSHPALDLLEKPNSDMVKEEFLEQIARYYDITGDSFLYATGDIKQPPIEIGTIGPQFVDFSTNSNLFGLLNIPSWMTINNSQTQEVRFFAKDILGMGIRYLNKAEIPSDQKEIYHIRQFNPDRSTGRYRGMSPLSPIMLELQQFLEGNVSNLSTLKRGAKVSLAWFNKNDIALTDTQWERMQEQAEKYSGSANSGSAIVLDGMDVKSIQHSNRDMEFNELTKSLIGRIAAIFRIPLAIVTDSVMTMNNLQTANFQLYDSSILPLANRLNKELTNFLLPRYPDSQDLEFSYCESDIPTLQARSIESTREKSRIYVNTDNELRAMLGDEPIDGGDQIYKPGNLTPAGSTEPLDPDTDFRDLPNER